MVCGGEADPQLRAIEKEIATQLKKQGVKNCKWEGVLSSGWRVLDLGSIVAHVLREEERAYYQLEKLWGKQAVVYHY